MIVKKNNFRLSSGTLYGFGGAVFGIVTVGLMINSHLAPETYPACTARYAQAGMFALKGASGSTLQPVELQSRLAGHEWGVLHNIAVRSDASAPMGAAMAVRFEAGGKLDRDTRTASGGIGFKWQPRFLDKAASACLSYSVKLGDGFKFANGGTLPGLFGASLNARINNKEDFSVRMRWLKGGRLGVQQTEETARDSRPVPIDEKWLEMPVGRWVEIEQEVVLNTPGQSDGVLRVWVDGKLHMNAGGLSFRKSADATFAGVIADTHYADSIMDWQPAPNATTIELSPLLVRWN